MQPFHQPHPAMPEGELVQMMAIKAEVIDQQSQGRGSKAACSSSTAAAQVTS
jgi:hypothetical protein